MFTVKLFDGRGRGFPGAVPRKLASGETPSASLRTCYSPLRVTAPDTNRLDGDRIAGVVGEVLDQTPVVDIHTHLFPPSFGACALSGVDALLTYHYLEAEFFRASPMTPEAYWQLQVSDRADAIWKTLFVERSPLSEATRGVVAVLDALGLDPGVRSLEETRAWFASQAHEEHVDRVMDLAGVRYVVMTNDPLDPDEMRLWTEGRVPGDRFRAALRLDRVVNEWDAHVEALRRRGFPVEPDAGGRSATSVRRFLEASIEKLDPLYMAVSLPDTFRYPAEDVRSRLLSEAVLPHCREAGIPLACMIGVRRQVNPRLRLAGDASGRADVKAVAALAERHPEIRFLVSMLSRENQHELCVYARKFANILPFGCWWFLNNPSIVTEITRERLEMLGTGFVPQHSDARILEQLIYKWRNTRRTLRPVLAETYGLLAADGGRVTRSMIERDVVRLSSGNFEDFVRSRGEAA